jgi:hypothetical protein
MQEREMPTAFKTKTFLISSIFLGLFSCQAIAAELPAKAGAERTVKMFDTFCFSQLPDIDAIAKIAKGNFTPITGLALRAFGSDAPTDRLMAWKFEDLGSNYVLSATAGSLDAQAKKDMPEFAQAKSTACSFHAINNDPQREILSQMAALMDRKPDDTSKDSRFKIYHWGGVTDTLMVNIYYYAAAKGTPGGLLSVVLFQKP